MHQRKARLDKLWAQYRYSQHPIHDYYSCLSHHGERPDLQQALRPIKQKRINLNLNVNDTFRYLTLVLEKAKELVCKYEKNVTECDIV